ncbi:transcription initiation factor IIB 3 [Halobacteriales archaeon QH_7_66_36]|nr:MAG: transcription initiation factor IIB 3 [Halobacteriales archaeon QH_7_66_36]
MSRPSRERQREPETAEEVEDESESGCPDCGSDTLVTTGDHETVCDDCGLVVDDSNIDRGPEWRAFNHTERQSKSRVGAPTTQTMHDKDAGERNLQFALSEIDRMSSALGVPHSVREVASVIYRRALDDDLIRGRSIEGVATSALYAACRQEGIPRSLEEISDVSRVERKEIGRTYRYVSQELALEMEPVDPKKYVPRFCSSLGVSDEVRAKAKEIIDITAEQGLLSGKSPTGYAAAAIYAASLLCNEKKTQREVADVAQVTEVTIRNRYQEQIEAMELY